MTRWFKDPRGRYAASTVAGIRTVFKMLLEDAVDERLIASNPVLRRRLGRRRDRAVLAAERVWAMPEHVVRLAEQAAVLGEAVDHYGGVDGLPVGRDGGPAVA